VVERLVDAGAAIEHSNDEGWTALFEAAHAGHADTVETLLRLGARTDQVDTHGLTALDYARSAGHTAVVELLQVPD
jgi:ankyrin repeat protein